MSSSSRILPQAAFSSHDHGRITTFIGLEHVLAQRTTMKLVEEEKVNRLRSRDREKWGASDCNTLLEFEGLSTEYVDYSTKIACLWCWSNCRDTLIDQICNIGKVKYKYSRVQTKPGASMLSILENMSLNALLKSNLVGLHLDTDICTVQIVNRLMHCTNRILLWDWVSQVR